MTVKEFLLRYDISPEFFLNLPFGSVPASDGLGWQASYNVRRSPVGGRPTEVSLAVDIHLPNDAEASGLTEAERALLECARASGADVSGGIPDEPPLHEWAVACVRELRADYDEALRSGGGDANPDAEREADVSQLRRGGTDPAMVALLRAGSEVRGGLMNRLRGAPSHVLAELLGALEADGWYLTRREPFDYDDREVGDA